ARRAGPGAPVAGRAALDRAVPARQAPRRAARQGLEVIRVGLLEEVKLLGAERAVGDRRREDQVIACEQRARLDPDRGAGGVARDQAGRDAEPLRRLASLVLVAEHRIDLADEDRGL